MMHGAFIFRASIFFIFLSLNGALPSQKIEISSSLQEDCPLETCSFSRRANLPVDSISDHFWIPVGWAPCNKDCGGGIQKARLACFARNFTQVAPAYCEDLPAIVIEQACNVISCPAYSVYRSPWSECSKTCGTGYQTREVLCKNKLGLLVASSKCDLEENLIESQECNTEPCGESYWTLSRWGECDALCGGGKQTRSPVCESYKSVCSGTKPDAERLCNSQPCQTYTWLVGSWKSCPYACEATTERLVQCVDSYGFEHPDIDCPGRKPSISISCKQPHISCDDCINNCFGNGVCKLGACSCFDGWSGKYCQSPSNCRGFLGFSKVGDVECCRLVDVNQKCCESPAASLDKDGYCCESGILDSYGACDGGAGMVDFEGKPCYTIRDEKGICCDSGVLDECHICDGDGTTCSTNMTLYLNVTGHASSIQDGNAFQQFLSSSMDRVAARLRLADDAISVASVRMLDIAGEECSIDDLQESSCAENQVLRGLAVIGVTVLPTSREVFIRKNDIIAALQPGPLFPFSLLKDLDADLILVGDIRRTGVCGNGLCERGERCNIDGTSASTRSTSCCLQDCPYVCTMCPAPMAGPKKNITCSGNGICLDSTGQCDCFRGYAGADCSQCAFGWIGGPNDGCVMLPGTLTLSQLGKAYGGDSITANATVLPSSVHKVTSKGVDALGWTIIFVLGGIIIGLLLLLVISTRKERNRVQVRQRQIASFRVAPASPETTDGDKDSNWKSNYPGPHSEFDVIPITPMLPVRRQNTLAETPTPTPSPSPTQTFGNDTTALARRWHSRKSFFTASSSVGPSALELRGNQLATDEDLTEEEQAIMTEKLRKELKRGSSAKFITNYLTDSESDEDEADEEHSHERTPDLPAVNNPVRNI